MKRKYKQLILIHLGILIIIVLANLFINSKYIYMMPKCWIYEKTGLLCPACYGTRFLVQFARFNFITAFKLHPMFFILAVYLIIVDVIYIINTIFNKKIQFFKCSHIILWAILLIIYTILRNII